MAPIGVPPRNRRGAFATHVTWVSTVLHVLLLNGEAISVKRRSSMHCIDFLMGLTREGNVALWLKLCDFREMEVANFHRRHHHFKRLFSRRANGRTHQLNIS